MNADNPYLKRCFRGKTTEERNFRLYLEVLSRSSEKPSRDRPEKHHVVPREWLRANLDGFSSKNEDQRNVVYLGVRDKIVAMMLVAVMFLEMGDSVTYRSVTESMSRRYGMRWLSVWKNPFLSKETIDILSERRRRAISGRKVRYDDAYLERCRDIMLSEDDMDKAFEKVKAETGFAFTRSALEEQLKRRFGRSWKTCLADKENHDG